jgi:hypothetical protein
MPKDMTPPPAKKTASKPMWDFELTKTQITPDKKRTETKGRFLFWGKVDAKDCPA